MCKTDPVADMLTRLRNASMAGLKYSVVPASSLKINITQVLETEGFIRGYRLIKDGMQGKIKIALKYDEQGQAVMRGISRASKPGRRMYTTSAELSKQRGMSIAIISTSKGVLAGKEAVEKKIGGEVLAYVW